MHYYFCSRCNFRMTAIKPLCPTCGYKIPRPSKQSKAVDEPKEQVSASIWSKIAKWDFASPSSKKTESA
jgi:predicted amidophosphoribosyltransferase